KGILHGYQRAFQRCLPGQIEEVKARAPNQEYLEPLVGIVNSLEVRSSYLKAHNRRALRPYQS
ncbi:MAG: hypothetical protein ACE5Q3_20205, partial [Alphaproteobacteria bacterium]